MEPGDRKALLAIAAGNLVTIVIAVLQGWSPLLMLWPFWFQSVAIGWYNGRRMLALKRFSTEGFTSKGQRVPENESGKRSTVFFFAIHYGFFHLCYGLFLLAMTGAALDGTGDTAAQAVPILARDLLLTFALGALFFATQRTAFREQLAFDATRKPNLGAMMFMPYLRIFPMHLMILVGAMVGSAGAGSVFFGVLKTLADVGMHLVEHRVLRARKGTKA